jgi:predicted PurR-regulated permease PerM
MIDGMITVLLALFGAMVVGETARPIVNRLAMHMSRPVAMAVVFGALFALLAAMAFLPVQLLVRQIGVLIADLPRVIPFSLPAGAIRTLAPFIARDPLGLVPAFSVLGLTLVMALFWLGASAQLTAFALTLLPPNHRDEAQSIFSDIGTKLGAYVGGTVVNAAIVVVLGTLGLMVLHVPNALVLGLFQGVLVGIPYLGTFIAVMTALIVTGTTEGWLKAAEAGALIAIVQTLVGTFVSPLIFKKRVDVDPLGCVVSGAVGGTLFGIPGIILAVPAASVVKTVVVRVIAPAIRRRSIAIVLMAHVAAGACAPAQPFVVFTGNQEPSSSCRR